MNINNAIISLITATSIFAGSSNMSNISSLNTSKTATYSTQTTIATSVSSKSLNNDSYIYFLSTGNSDSILIKTQSKTILIDGGDNDDESLIVNFIKNKNIKKIDYLIATHPDSDHVGALDKVVDSFSIGKALVGNSTSNSKTYRDFISSLANKKINPSVPLEGAKFTLEKNSYIQFFNTKGGSNANESSLVILFVNGNDKILFMGDAGFETENKILNKLPDVDLIKIGHHASKGSSSDALLKKVKPESAVITTGPNSYGHPSQTVLSKLKSLNIDTHRTDVCGTITFKSTGNGLSTNCNKANLSTVSNNLAINSNTTTTQKQQNSESVVLTKSGKKYHKENCKYVSNIKEYTTISKAISKGYSKCNICFN